jgi:cbb3-type cytochrome oxidase subunit 3
MIPSRAELLRRRRCRMLAFGMVLGALLPIFQRSWITLAVGLAGIAVLLVVYRRECRDETARESTQDDTHARGPEA